MIKKVKILGLGMIIMLLAGTQVYGQKCKYKVDKADAFTGELTRQINVMFNLSFVWEFNKKGNNHDITLNVIIQMSETSRQGDSVLFRVVSAENPSGTTVVLHSSRDVAPSMTAKASGTAYAASAQYLGTYKITYEITKEQLQILKNGTITFIRIQVGSRSYDIKVTSGQGKRMKNAATCILQ